MKNEQKITILAVMLTAFVTSFTGSALNLAIPDIGAHFRTKAGDTDWIVTGYTVTVALLSIPAGCLADRAGRKRILAAGLVVFTAASVTAVFSVSVIMLILSRAVQGAGASMIFSTNTAILADSFSEDQRGKMMGYSLAATYAGLSAGPFLGGVINHNFGWQAIFIITGSVSLMALLLTLKGVPDRRPGGEAAGSVIITELKNNKPFICSGLAALLNYGATFTVSYLLSIYLQVVQGYSSQTAGLIMLAQPVVISILSPFAGKKSDTVSPFKLSAIGMAVCGVGIALSLLLADDRVRLMWGVQLAVVVAVLLIVGAGSALFSSPNTNAVMSRIKPEGYGFASSVLSSMRALGNTFGMLLITSVSSIYIGDTVLKQADPYMIIKTMVIVMSVSGLLCLLGTLLARVK